MYRRIILTSVLTLAALLCASAASAQSHDYDVRPEAAQVTGKALTDSFSGVTHDGAYNFDARGRPGMRYTEHHNVDGSLSYTERGQTITGQWKTTADMICYSYDSGNVGGGCFRVYKLGSCYYFYSSYFTPREDESDQDYWTARSVPKGKRATCEDMIS